MPQFTVFKQADELQSANLLSSHSAGVCLACVVEWFRLLLYNFSNSSNGPTTRMSTLKGMIQTIASRQSDYSVFNKDKKDNHYKHQERVSRAVMNLGLKENNSIYTSQDSDSYPKQKFIVGEHAGETAGKRMAISNQLFKNNTSHVVLCKIATNNSNGNNNSATGHHAIGVHCVGFKLYYFDPNRGEALLDTMTDFWNALDQSVALFGTNYRLTTIRLVQVSTSHDRPLLPRHVDDEGMEPSDSKTKESGKKCIIM